MHLGTYFCYVGADLRKVKICCTTAAGKEEWEIGEKQSCKHKGHWRMRGGAPGTRAGVSLQPLEKITLEQAAFLQPTVYHGRADATAHEGLHTWDILEEL